MSSRKVYSGFLFNATLNVTVGYFTLMSELLLYFFNIFLQICEFLNLFYVSIFSINDSLISEFFHFEAPSIKFEIWIFYWKNQCNGPNDHQIFQKYFHTNRVKILLLPELTFPFLSPSKTLYICLMFLMHKQRVFLCLWVFEKVLHQRNIAYVCC